MRLRITEKAAEDYAGLPDAVRRAFQKQLRLMLEDARHPSLQAKKYDAARAVWQARVNRSWRFYFQIRGDEYVILAVIPHPK